MDITAFFVTNSWLLWVLLAWTLPWKGVALWKAAHKGHKAWFVVLLIVNTVAILEILYIYVFSKRKQKTPHERDERLHEKHLADADRADHEQTTDTDRHTTES